MIVLCSTVLCKKKLCTPLSSPLPRPRTLVLLCRRSPSVLLRAAYEQHWDKDVCLNFADRCLSFLKDNVDEGPRYAFRYLEPFDQLTLEQIRSPAGEAGGPGAAISLVQGGAAGYMERYE